jgi:gliding motility-associated-like protein
VTLAVTNANGCTDQHTKTIIIFPNPEASFTFEHFCWNSITQFTSQSFVNDPNGTTLDIHDWNFGDPSTGAANTSNEVNPIHNFSRPGTFNVTLTVTTSRGCTNTIVVPVFVPAVALPVPTHDTICYGEQGNVYMWNPNPAIGTLEWFYSPDGVDPFLVGNSSYTTPPLSQDTYYFVALRDEDGCLSPKVPVAVYVKPEPNIDFTVNSQVLDIPHAIAEFTVTQEHYGPIISYLWDFGDGSVSGEMNPVHQYNEEGTYDVTIHLVNDYGCETTINLPLYIKVNKLVRIFVPTAFTPNGDGRNDYFEVYTTLITDFHIDIFDRWGKLVYATDDMAFKWDGNGQPEDAYTYVINATEWSGEKVRKVGTITIIR